MNSSHHRWLLEQLPTWEKDGLLTPDAARTLRDRHAIDDSQPSTGQIIMGALGALLIGAGLITVIGYNWDAYSRPVRLLFAALPLLVAQFLSLRVLLQGESAQVWVRESVALFQALATGACIAIVSQIYNLGGDWPDFLFWWMLLSVPLAWVLRSKAVAIFYLICITVWSLHQVDHVRHWYDSALLYPVLLLGLAPFWPGWPPRWRFSPSLQYVTTFSVALGLAAAAASSVLVFNPDLGRKYDSIMWLWIFNAAAILLLPLPPPEPDEKRRHDPHVSLSALFLLGTSLWLTFFGHGDRVLQDLVRALQQPWAWVTLALIAGFSALAIKRQRWGLVGVGSLALTPMLALAAGSSGPGLLPWLMNLHLLALGVVLILLDFTGRRGSPRLGAALICMLVLVRMFESDLSLLLKGIVFILIGVAFLAFNILTTRAHKRAKSATLS